MGGKWTSNEEHPAISEAFCKVDGKTACISDVFAILDEIRMAGFMHQTNEIDDVPFDLVTKIVRKRAAVFAGKAVWADMIAAFPTDDGSYRILDPFVEIAAESVGNGVIPGFRIQQVLFEKR